MHTEEIVICVNCKGRGYLTVQKLVDYHRGEYETSQFECSHCKGKGRRIKITKIEFKELP